MRVPTLAFLLSLLLGAGPAAAHNYDPALAPFATVHRMAIAKIAEKRDKVTQVARDEYLVELQAAQRDAVLNKEKKLVERIDAEMQAVKNRAFASTEGFPRKLISARGSLENTLKQAGAEAEREARPVNASYLADLNRIPVGKDSGELLARQIESEKKAIMNGVIGPVINPETDLAGTKWSLISDPKEVWTFTYTTELKMKGTWRVSFPEPDKFVVHWNKSAKVELKLASTGRFLLRGGKPFAKLETEEK